MQARLILLGLVVFALMGVGLVAYHYKVAARDAEAATVQAKAETRQTKADLKVATDVNDANQATIGRLQAQAASDAKLTAQLAEQIAAANQAFINNNAALTALKDANADVSHFLALPVPADLRKLYDPGAGAAGDR
ncbi:MAG: hypothetical protein EOR97_17365 [Mesorhizobium sp.]|uniref:hypothetical protein n=1 Tax=Mesorhizobium sp. TaxID=1871066 RepID=UPI000FE6832B|nr:hypothetical protein [Mesorhizobium sp.]RWN30141.1 MAG: hypothetical protein EOR97_17365 [Mesorhizobium sp.]